MNRFLQALAGAALICAPVAQAAQAAGPVKIGMSAIPRVIENDPCIALMRHGGCAPTWSLVLVFMRPFGLMKSTSAKVQ